MKNTIEIIKALTGYDLYKYKRRNSSASLRDVVAYDKEMKNQKTGTVFVSKSKGDLSQGKGFVVTSYETLNDNIDQLTHWTPNTFLGGTYYDFSNRIIKGHTKNNLKQINTLGYDIDTKQVDLYRSEERRVGKECRNRWVPYRRKKRRRVGEAIEVRTK